MRDNRPPYHFGNLLLKVRGSVFPFMMVNYGSGQKISETTFQEYRVNEAIEDSVFEPRTEIAH